MIADVLGSAPGLGVAVDGDWAVRVAEGREHVGERDRVPPRSGKVEADLRRARLQVRFVQRRPQGAGAAGVGAEAVARGHIVAIARGGDGEGCAAGRRGGESHLRREGTVQTRGAETRAAQTRGAKTYWGKG